MANYAIDKRFRGAQNSNQIGINSYFCYDRNIVEEGLSMLQAIQHLTRLNRVSCTTKQAAWRSRVRGPTALTPAESRWFVQRGRRVAGNHEPIAWLSPERNVGVETNGQ